MATVHGRSKTPTGEHEFEIDIQDEHVPRLVEALLGGTKPLDPRRSEKPKRVRYTLLGALPRKDAERMPIPPSELEKMRSETPSIDSIVAFIQKQPEYSHNLEGVANEFWGKVPRFQSPNPMEKRLIFLLQDRTAEARKRIARTRENGAFQLESRQFGKSRTYRWVNNGGKTRQG